jgi:Protein of unknown function (DUF3618)
MTRGGHQKSQPKLAEMEQQIAETREELGAIVEELAAKADLTGRAKAKAADTASRMRETGRRAAATASAPMSRLHSGGHRSRPGPHTLADEIPLAPASRAGATLYHPDGEGTAGPAHRRMPEDRLRTAYGAATVVLAAATVAAVVWSRRQGDGDRFPAVRMRAALR